MRSRTASTRRAWLLSFGILGAAGWVAGGCHRGPALVGTWQGAPQTQEVVQKVTDGKANPVAQGFVNAAVQGLANTFLSVRIQFKSEGTAYYSGNTGALGLPPESDGPWYVIKQEGDVFTVRLGTSDHPLQARIVFRERDKFTLVRQDAPDTPLVFTRVD
jgi:hypothetical protein